MGRHILYRWEATLRKCDGYSCGREIIDADDMNRPKCEPVIKKVKRGDPSFPTAAPVWPQEVFGRALEPEARVAAPEPTQALKQEMKV